MDKLFCYVRVSSRSQKDDGNSIERQIALGKRVAKLKGLEYVEMLEGKEGVGSSKRYRPIFQDILSRIEGGEIKHIWYLDRTRWSRGGEIGSQMEGVEDAYVLHHYLKPNKVKVYEGENGSERTFDTPESQLFDQIQSLFSKMESDKIRHRSVSGKRFVGKKYGSAGRFLGGTVNFGYSNENKTWIENKEESKVVRELFKRYAKGQKIKDLKNWLDTENIRPRRAKSWNLETIRKMLNNEVYTGVFVWVSKDTNETFTHTVPQLVSHTLFKKVQSVLEKNKDEERRNNRRKTPTLLDGLLKCGDCGNSVTGKVKLYKGKRPDSKTYSCIIGLKKYQKQQQLDCSNKRSLNMERTDEFVSDVVRKVLGESSVLKETFKTQILNDKNTKKSEIREEQKKLEQQIRRLDSQITGTEESISVVKFKILQGEEDESIGNKLVDRLMDELSNQKQLRQDKIGRIEELNHSEEWIDWVQKYLSETDLKFAKDPKNAIAGIVSKITVTPEFGKGRDGKELQTGHRLKIHFNMPIVDDSIEYEDEREKSKGYTVKNGKKVLNAGQVSLHSGGRPAKKKDQQNNPLQTNSVTVE
ncbi:MAG: recombinase family protein [Parvibaculales bacterium]